MDQGKNNIIVGIGPNATPTPVREALTTRARAWGEGGAVLRTSGVSGIADALLAGMPPEGTELHIAYPGHCDFDTNTGAVVLVQDRRMTEQADAIAQEHYPAWDECSENTRALLRSHIFQVLGADLNTPADRLVCWTPGGTTEGKTGMAMRIARRFGVTVENIGDLNGIAPEAVCIAASESVARRNLATPIHPPVHGMIGSPDEMLSQLRAELRGASFRGSWVREVGHAVAMGEWVALVTPDFNDFAVDTLSSAVRGVARHIRSTHPSLKARVSAAAVG